MRCARNPVNIEGIETENVKEFTCRIPEVTFGISVGTGQW